MVGETVVGQTDGALHHERHRAFMPDDATSCNELLVLRSFFSFFLGDCQVVAWHKALERVVVHYSCLQCCLINRSSVRKVKNYASYIISQDLATFIQDYSEK